MDHKLKGLLKHYVLAFMLLGVQWKLVVSAPIPTSCADNLDSTRQLTELLKHEAAILLTEYENIHFQENRSGSIPMFVDNFTVSGASLTEKLQSVYRNNVLLYLHILKVEENEGIWKNTKIVTGLSSLKGALSNHSAKIKNILMNIYPEIPLPPTPPPLQLSHGHDYAKKVYGWEILFRLRDWQTEVLKVIEELNTVCDSWSSS